jgi:hypothetical protein
MNQQNQVKNNNNNNNNNNNDNTQSEILEQGDIYFFYRPKKGAEEVKGIEDIRRFFMVTAPEQEENNNKSRLYRLFIVGKKSLPEVRKTEARASERYWARVGGIFKEPDELARELFSDEFRKGDAARPVGEGKYAIIRHHQNHTELAYILELPKEPGEAQRELGIEKEASYVILVINPKVARPSSTGRRGAGNLPSIEEPVKYPEEVLKEFDETENFVSLDKDTKFIDYQNAQIILIGAREGRDVIRSEMGIEIAEESPQQQSADIFNKLKVRKEQVPIRPLTEGKLE